MLLGDLYQNGGDYAQAVRWYEKAAKSGSPEGQYYLGMAYQRGEGVPQDMAQAIHWYRGAAIGGDRKSQLMLGVQYASGRYVKQNFELAYAWAALAAEPPDAAPYATQIRDALASHLKRAELAKSQELVQSWKVGHDIE
jgi:TPR repeat protein